MSSTTTFEFVLILLVAIVALELIARKLRLPTAAALLAEGGRVASSAYERRSAAWLPPTP